MCHARTCAASKAASTTWTSRSRPSKTPRGSRPILRPTPASPASRPAQGPARRARRAHRQGERPEEEGQPRSREGDEGAVAQRHHVSPGTPVAQCSCSGAAMRAIVQKEKARASAAVVAEPSGIISTYRITARAAVWRSLPRRPCLDRPHPRREARMARCGT